MVASYSWRCRVTLRRKSSPSSSNLTSDLASRFGHIALFDQLAFAFEGGLDVVPQQSDVRANQFLGIDQNLFLGELQSLAFLLEEFFVERDLFAYCLQLGVIVAVIAFQKQFAMSQVCETLEFAPSGFPIGAGCWAWNCAVWASPAKT